MNSEAADTQGTALQGKARSCHDGAGGGIHVDVFDNFDELAPMQQEWDNFVESVGAEIFLTYDWCRIWWKYYGKNRVLRVFVFRSNNKLIGIIPLFFEKIWLGPVFVRVAKIVGTDFTITTVSLPIVPDSVEAVMKEFLGGILTKYKLDIVHLGPLCGLYPSMNLMKVCSRLLSSSYCISQRSSGFQTYVRLAGSWEEYLNGLSRNMRRTIKRSYRDLYSIGGDNTKALLADIAKPDNCEATFERFVQMHQLHWRKLGKLGHFADWPSALEFHREVARAQLERGRLRLVEVKLGSVCLGYEYDYKFGDKYHAFLNARVSSDEVPGAGPCVSLGNVVFSEQLKRALKENVEYIDMMPGTDEYKLRLGGESFPIGNIYIFPKKLFVLTRVFLFRAFSCLLNFCYYRMWFCRIAPKLPFKRRSLWQIWMHTRAFG